jgi:hypothetical protein
MFVFCLQSKHHSQVVRSCWCVCCWRSHPGSRCGSIQSIEFRFPTIHGFSWTTLCSRWQQNLFLPTLNLVGKCHHPHGKKFTYSGCNSHSSRVDRLEVNAFIILVARPLWLEGNNRVLWEMCLDTYGVHMKINTRDGAMEAYQDLSKLGYIYTLKSI